MREQTRQKPSVSEAANLSERALTELLKKKDKEGMKLFYERYAGYLTAVCSRYVTDRAEVKDILQDALVKMFGAVDRFEFRGEGSLRAWASRIVVNGALTNLREKGRFTIVDNLPDIEDDDPVQVEKVPPAVLQGFIQALPDGYRTVFNLFVFEKKSHKEIADMLGIKEDSSASQYLRARARLAKQIKTYLKEHE